MNFVVDLISDIVDALLDEEDLGALVELVGQQGPLLINSELEAVQ